MAAPSPSEAAPGRVALHVTFAVHSSDPSGILHSLLAAAPLLASGHPRLHAVLPYVFGEVHSLAPP